MFLRRNKRNFDAHAEGVALVDYAGAMLVEVSDAVADALEFFAVEKRSTSALIEMHSSMITALHVRHERSHQAQRRAEELADDLDVLLGGSGEV